MYEIDEFAKIVDIPVSTLKFYDLYGLLQPSEIDDKTGNHYYSDENIKECELITLLLSNGYSFEDIDLLLRILRNEKLVIKQLEAIKQKELLRKKLKRLTIMKEDFQTVQNIRILKK